MEVLCKTCTGCQKNLSMTNEFFHRHKLGIGGFHPRCKSCRSLDDANLYQRNESRRTKIRNAAKVKPPAAARFHANKRRARKLKASPKWTNFEAIKCFYKECPKGMVVDHIIPLQGKNVCGLHVVENLQYLTPKENRVKGNRFYN